MKKGLVSLFNEFIFECEYARKLKPATIRGYKSVFSFFITLCPDVTRGSLDTHTVITFFKELETRNRVVGRGLVKTGVKKSTIATYWSKLNPFFKWLKSKELIKANPFDSMAYPTPTYEDKQFLSRNEVERIMTAVITNATKNVFMLKRNLLLIHLLLFCGLRKEELLQLQIRDIDLSKKELTIRRESSKSDRTRCLPLHAHVLMHLVEYLKARRHYTCQYLLVSSLRDERLTGDGLKHLVDALRQRSGVPFHLHQFRHTFAVNFLKQSGNVTKLRQLLGHKDITVTMIYLRCLPPSEMQGDIERMRIDFFL